jgi:Fe-S-cluster-containing dehydrogenase component
VIDLEKCTGCGICEKECPWHVPDFDADSRKVYMCTLCFERIRTGLEPACVEACPEDAIIFGDRKDLLSKAKETGKHIYGEAEAGGTSVIYISSIPLDQLGFPKVQASVMETHYRKAR